MISLRAARPSDAPAIGAVHVAAWRSAYPGILPDDYLARLSVARQAAHYDGAIRGRAASLRRGRLRYRCATWQPAAHRRVYHRRTRAWRRDRRPSAGRGRGGDAVCAGRLARARRRAAPTTCRGWAASGGGGVPVAVCVGAARQPGAVVLPATGGKPAAEAPIKVAGQSVMQTAFVWDPIQRLLAASPQAS